MAKEREGNPPYALSVVKIDGAIFLLLGELVMGW
jgi:hypothetical protein